MDNYQEAYDKCIKLIQQKKNIILLGSGNNGKTFLINNIIENLREYHIFHEFDNIILNLINTDKPFITAINTLDTIKHIDSDLYQIIDMNNIHY